MPITFVVDADSKTPPFEQIKQAVITAIAERTAVVDEKLPAIRGLASELGLAVNTVARSYRELEEEGYVITQGRSGTRIKAGAVPAEIALEQLTKDHVSKLRALGISESQASRALRAAYQLT